MLRSSLVVLVVVMSACGGNTPPPFDGGMVETDAGVQRFSVASGATSLAAGDEKTWCVTKRLDNASPIHVGTIEARLTGAWTEVVVSLVNDTTESSVPCTPLRGLIDVDVTPILFTRSNEVIALPAGYGISFAAQQMIRIELHGSNTGAGAENVEANFTFTATEAQKTASLLLAMTPDISLAPGQLVTVTSPVRVPAGELLEFTGFTHQLGTGFSVSSGGSTLYEPSPFMWNAPQRVTASTTIAADAGVRLECTWNNTSNANVNFGTAMNDELCLLRTYRSPASTSHLCVHSEQTGSIDFCCPGSPLCAQLF